MKRILGNSGIEVNPVGMGCWAIGGVTYSPVHQGSGPFSWGEVDDEESVKAIHAALDAGINLFDTADVYGGGHSEEVLGKALHGRRQEAVIATKFGWAFDSYTRQMTEPDTTPQYIRRACEGSLRRLRTDYIDLYQLHIGEYDPAYLDDVIDVLDRLADAGKIRSYGWVTGFGVEGAKVFSRRRHCASIQHRLNVLDDSPEILAACKENGVASINLAPLAMSLLTGKYTNDTRFTGHDLRSGWNFGSGSQAEQLKKVEQLREILTSDGRTLVQGALCWILSRSDITIPIPGIKSVKQAVENAGAMAFKPFNETQMRRIDEIAGRG